MHVPSASRRPPPLITPRLTGRRVDDRHGGHGYAETSTPAGPSIKPPDTMWPASSMSFTTMVARRPCLPTKAKFRVYRRTWNTHGAADRTGRNDERAKIDRVTIDLNNTGWWRNSPPSRHSPREFTFVHLSLPDRVGHAHRFMGNEYLAAVQRTDRLLGRIINTVADRRSYAATLSLSLPRITVARPTTPQAGAIQLPDSLHGLGPRRSRGTQSL